MTKYEKAANKALEAGLSAVPSVDVWKFWKELEVTRQTKWVWSAFPDRVPLMARLAVAWLKYQGVTPIAVERSAPVKACPSCHAMSFTAAKQCGTCGHMFRCES